MLLRVRLWHSSGSIGRQKSLSGAIDLQSSAAVAAKECSHGRQPVDLVIGEHQPRRG